MIFTSYLATTSFGSFIKPLSNQQCRVQTFSTDHSTIISVHRCGASGSMRACHAAAPCSIPGRDKFPG